MSSSKTTITSVCQTNSLDKTSNYNPIIRHYSLQAAKQKLCRVLNSENICTLISFIISKIEENFILYKKDFIFYKKSYFITKKFNLLHLYIQAINLCYNNQAERSLMKGIQLHKKK